MIDPAVVEVLTTSQRLGFLGERKIDEVIAHARHFVVALEGITGTVADIGSGGGLPGFVIAHDRPDMHVVLIDRRAKRTDFLDRMTRRLGWTDRVSVVCADVAELVAGSTSDVDAVVARGFGPPEHTLRLGTQLVRPTGRVVISEPPEGHRWGRKLLGELGVVRCDDGSGAVSVFETTWN